MMAKSGKQIAADREAALAEVTGHKRPTWARTETAIRSGELQVIYPIRDTIDRYYVFREYARPDLPKSALFLFSEVGELADALLSEHLDAFTPTERQLLTDFKRLGAQSDSLVSGQGAWARNNHRSRPPSLQDEIPDVLMMLDRTALEAGLPEPHELLFEKMQDKGFVP